eukprot:gene9863-13270_t
MVLLINAATLILAFLFFSHNLNCEEFVPPSKPNYEELEIVPSSKIWQDPVFIAACKEMAGYYKDPTKNPSLSKTIMMSGINYSYRDFYHNFKCYTDRLGIKFLPVALDEPVYTYVTNQQKSPSFLMPDIPGRERVKTEAQKFGGKNFNLIGCRKLEAVGGALKLGYDVVFSDVDIALLRDPINYLFFEEIDYVHSENNGCLRKWSFNDTMEGNTGFYSVKSNARTIRTWDLAYKFCSKAPLYDDQTIFWLILRTNMNPEPAPLLKCPPPSKAISSLTENNSLKSKSNNNKIVSCPLDNCMFSASNLRDFNQFSKLTGALNRKNQPAIMAHANWMSGKDKKKSAMMQCGLWIASRSGGSIGPAMRKKGNKKTIAEINAEINSFPVGNVTWSCNILKSELLSVGSNKPEMR